MQSRSRTYAVAAADWLGYAIAMSRQAKSQSHRSIPRAIVLAGFTALMGCTVHAGAQVDASVAGGGDCDAKRDACVDDCRAEAPDIASRGPCFNDCVRSYDACRAP